MTFEVFCVFPKQSTHYTPPPPPLLFIVPVCFTLPWPFTSGQPPAPFFPGRKAAVLNGNIASVLSFLDVGTFISVLLIFGGKMLARSLKNIWTGEKLVYLCGAKDKMVSNPATILQDYQFPCNKSSAPSQLSVQLLPAWGCSSSICPFFFKESFSVYLAGRGGGGCPWVWSNLQLWSCPTGLQAILFCAWGGEKEWGGASGSHKLPCSVAPAPPRALAESWWECARSELSSWPFN